MKSPSFRFAPAVIVLLAGCSQATDSGGGRDAGASITLANKNNYRSTASLTLPTVETASGVDLDICWTNIATDMQCHPVSPQTDIDNVAFLRLLHLTSSQAEVKLVSGGLTQSQIDGYLEFHTEKQTTCARLSQFSFLGSKVDVLAEYQESADETYLLLFTRGVERGVGARVMMFLRPVASSTNTRVDATSGCGTLAFAADLTTPERVSVPAAGPWTADWSSVTADGQGNEIIYSTLDKLLLGYYQGMTVADIQAKFFDLETMATSLWDLGLTGAYTADLSQAVERKTGAPFAGFSGHASDGIWLLALLCSTCQNPAPVILAVLEPREGKK
jgi:hypothetical protein